MTLNELRSVSVDIAANKSQQAYDVEWTGATSASTIQPTNLSRHMTLNELAQRLHRHCSQQISRGIWRWIKLAQRRRRHCSQQIVEWIGVTLASTLQPTHSSSAGIWRWMDWRNVGVDIAANKSQEAYDLNELAQRRCRHCSHQISAGIWRWMNWCNVGVDIAPNTSEQAYDVEWIGATSTSTLQPTNLSRHITLNELVQRWRRHCSQHIWAGIWRWMNWCNVDVDIAANNLSRHITLNELVQRRRRHCSQHIWASIWRWMNWCNADIDIPPSLLKKHHVLAGQVHTVKIQHLNNIVSTSQKIYDIAATWLHFFIFHYFNFDPTPWAFGLIWKKTKNKKKNNKKKTTNNNNTCVW